MSHPKWWLSCKGLIAERSRSKNAFKVNVCMVFAHDPQQIANCCWLPARGELAYTGNVLDSMKPWMYNCAGVWLPSDDMECCSMIPQMTVMLKWFMAYTHIV